jgi:hypothetical protein
MKPIYSNLKHSYLDHMQSWNLHPYTLLKTATSEQETDLLFCITSAILNTFWTSNLSNRNVLRASAPHLSQIPHYSSP